MADSTQLNSDHISISDLEVTLFEATHANEGQYNGWGWLNTGVGGGPMNSTWHACVVPLQNYKCSFGDTGWGF